MIEKYLDKLAKLENKRPKTFIAAFLIFTIIISTGFSLIENETSEESQLPEDIDTIISLNKIRDKIGRGGESVILIFRLEEKDPMSVSDIRDKRILESMENIGNQIEENEFVLNKRSVTDLVDISLSQKEINYFLEENPQSGDFITKDKRVAIMTFSLMADMPDFERDQLNNYIRNTVYFSERPLGMKVDFAGSAFLGEEIGRSLGGRTSYVTFIGFLAVFVILYLFFRRITFVGIAVVPIILSTIWTFGTLGYVGIPLSPPLTGVFSIIIGLGIDFAIHIIHRFKEDRKKYPAEEAITNAVVHVGKGLTLTSFTTIIGFLALLTATLTFLQDFSVALTFGVFYSLVAALGVVPPIMVIEERRRVKKNKK